jgi:selenocysteine lyase/cysteine desulfurase
VEQELAQLRSRLAQLLGADDPSRCIFTFSGTDSLNLALQGALVPGVRVLTTATEHNSVLRPLHYLQQSRGVQIAFIPCDAQGLPDLSAAGRLLPGCDWLVVNHASNVTGAVLPLADLVAEARLQGVRVLVDAAQTVGCLPWNVADVEVDLVAASGHKGLLGPLGTGFVYLAPHMQHEVAPFRFGGTGSASELSWQPANLPDRFEAGNLNVPGLIGLHAGLTFVLEQGVATIAEREQLLREQLVAGLDSISGVTPFAAPAAQQHTGVVAFQVAGFAPQEAVAILADQFGVQLRGGLHCAPRLHAALGTAPHGTLRASVGPFTTAAEVDQLLAAVRELAAAG